MGKNNLLCMMLQVCRRWRYQENQSKIYSPIPSGATDNDGTVVGVAPYELKDTKVRKKRFVKCRYRQTKRRTRTDVYSSDRGKWKWDEWLTLRMTERKGLINYKTRGSKSTLDRPSIWVWRRYFDKTKSKWPAADIMETGRRTFGIENFEIKNAGHRRIR